jgi:hypothetical protein
MTPKFVSGALTAIWLTLMAPHIAQAQSPTAFDGTYLGVSNAASGSGPNCSVFAPVPRPLTIQNGVAKFDGGLKGATAFQGNVTPQGAFTMKDNLANTITGRIESGGKATAGIHMGESNCVLTAVWQKS